MATGLGRLAAGMLALVVMAWSVTSPGHAKPFRAADNQVEDYPTVQALALMDHYIQEKTGGRHSIQIFHSGQLGDEQNTVEQTRAGGIDLARVNVTALATLVPATNALVLPFQFRSIGHLHAVLDGPIGQDVLAGYAAVGLVGLAFYDCGSRSIYNTVRPIHTPGDLKGLKIRVQPSGLMADLISALGATPVQLAYSQVLAALQTRLIDGAENNWPSFVSTGHYLSAPYITATEHVMSPEVLLMSRRAWDTLSAEDQAIFQEAARASTAFMRQRWQDWEEATRKQAVGSGALLVTEFDKAAFAAAAVSVRDRYLADPAVRDLAERIAAAQ